MQPASGLDTKQKRKYNSYKNVAIQSLEEQTLQFILVLGLYKCRVVLVIILVLALGEKIK